MKIRIHQVDAFTARPFSGNPAAVCLLPEVVDPQWMQQVALEMNLSETAFLVERKDGDYDLRWFTPACEVDLCGHATLASAHILWETELAADREARFHTRSGLLTARRVGDRIEMNFPAEPPRQAPAPPDLLQCLGIEAASFVGRNRMDYLVEIASEAELRSLKPDFSRLSRIEARGVIVTTPGQDTDHDFVSRFFAPQSGVDEDPVTGSAHCCLAPYWAKKLGREELRAYQASPRGGEITVRLSGDRVLLAGHAVTVLRATLEKAALPPTKTASEAEMDDRKSYQEKAEEQFERLGARIDELLGKVEAKARSGYRRAADEVREKRDTAGTRLKDLKSSSGEAWRELKPGFEHAWRDLRQAFEKAVEAFGK